MQTTGTLIGRKEIINAMIGRNRIFTFFEICKELGIDLNDKVNVDAVQEHFSALEKNGTLSRVSANSLMYYISTFGPLYKEYVVLARIKVPLGIQCMVRHPLELSEGPKEKTELTELNGKKGIVVGYNKDTLNIQIEGKKYYWVKLEYLLFQGPFELCKEGEWQVS